MRRLTDARIDVDALVREVATVDAGGICTFVGTARRRSEGRVVNALRYDAYPEMAEKVIEELLAAAMRKFPDAHVTAMHRLGPCPLGEASVAVVAAALHREQAFAACRFVIDALKKEAPIWKQELFEGGSEWIGDPGSLRPRSGDR